MRGLWAADVTRRPLYARYGLAVVAVAVALWLTLQLETLAVRMPFALFFAAVAFSAWYGGFRPGLLATALATLAGAYFLLPPVGELALDDPTSLGRVLIFALVALLINALSAARSQAESALAALLVREQQVRATTEETQRRVAALAAASRAFTEAGLDVGQVAEVTVRQLAETLGDNCVLRLLSADGRRLEPIASYHPDPAARAFLRTMVADSPYSLGEGPSSQVAQTGKPLLIPVVQPDALRPTIKPEYHSYLERFGVHSLLIVPLRARGQVIGTLRVSRDAPGQPYTPTDQAFLQDLADRAALALTQAQLHHTVEAERERMTVTLASIGDAVIATDAAAHVTFMNPVAETLTGWTRAAAQGQNLGRVFRIVDEASGAALENPASRVIREGRIVGLADHTVLQARDGTEYPIDDSGAPIRGTDGRLLGVVLVFRDVSARRQAALALQQSRDQLEIILHGVSDGITVQDPTGRLIYANEAAAHILGFPTAEALVAAPVAAFTQQFEVLDEAGQPFDMHQLPGRLALQGEASPEMVLGWRVRATGLLHWSIVKARPVRDGQGHVQLAINIFVDITIRKAATDRQQFLADVTALLAGSLDYETTLTQLAELAVPRLADWCGVDILAEDGSLRQLAVMHTDPAKIALARELRERYPPDPAAPSGVLNVVRTGQVHFAPEITDSMIDAAARDADHLHLLRALGARALLVVPLQARGRILGAVSLMMSESGRRYSAEDRALVEEVARRAGLMVDNAQLYQQAQAAITLRDEFLAMASHELKTPVTTIKGYTQLLLRSDPGRDEARWRRNLTVLAGQTDRLVALINQLLDISRIQTGVLGFTHTRFDLRQVVEEVLSEQALVAPDVVLQPDLPATPVPVEADRERLIQVVTNLVQNAIKYSGAAGRVAVTMRVDRPEVVLAVQDWGIGIPADQQDEVFGRFFRGRNAARSNYGGLGLGLFIVHQLVEAHGGRIWLESAEGRGSTFYVALPLAPDGGEPTPDDEVPG
jgi:PAS domain S-box-containing protein